MNEYCTDTGIIENLPGIELMGENVRPQLKFCGEGVRLFPLCKIIHADRIELDNHCQIFDNVVIVAGSSLKIGKYTTITWFSLIEGGASTSIGDRVFIGPGSKILNGTYEFNGCYSAEHLPDECRGTIRGDIIIKDDAYIGANCTILPGVIIGEGTVVGANSLVNINLEPWSIYVGSPCRKIGERVKPTEKTRTALQEFDDWSNHL